MDIIRENWEQIKNKVRTEYSLTNISYKTWVNPLEYHQTLNDMVYIIIQSDQTAQLSYIQNKFSNPFKVIISEYLEKEIDVSFILEKDIENTIQENEEIESLPINKEESIYQDNSNLNAKYIFDNFVIGSSNKLAYSACVAVAESPGQVYNPLYLYGGPGLGKTHLMHSIGHYILEQNPNTKVLYVTSEEFTTEVIESIRSGNAASMSRLRDKYRTVDVLMVDDIQFIIGKESTQEEFFHTFNALHSAGKQIVLSSDKPPKDIQTLDERFKSRFSWGLTVDIQAPDYETRVAILRDKNEANPDTQISEDIIVYIAENIKSNIRELEGAFNKIIAFSKLNKETPTMELAIEALKDIISPSKNAIVSKETIIKLVAESFDVRPEDITSQKRNAEFVLPRQVVMYLCQDILSMSYMNIAKLLGKKDHTTIIHGTKKINDEIKTNEDLAKKIELIRKKLV